jgi:YegS/Rv2252/BmrU family lipid kinase
MSSDERASDRWTEPRAFNRVSPSVRTIAVINASGGAPDLKSGELTPAKVQQLFAGKGVEVDVRFAAGEGLEEALQEAIAAEPELLIVGGGDGTISSAARALRGRPIVLGVLPLGTLNHFAKDLGIETVEHALAAISKRHTRLVDTGSLNGRTFINNCSIGPYPKAVKRRQTLQQTRGYKKGYAMVIAILGVMRNLRRMRVAIDSDGESRLRRTPVVLVSNNRYTGSFFSTQLRPQLSAGNLWVYTIRAHRFAPLVRLAALALLGRLERADEFECWPAKSVTISLPGETIEVGIDGEVLRCPLPLRLQIHPGALRVICPDRPR